MWKINPLNALNLFHFIDLLANILKTSTPNAFERQAEANFNGFCYFSIYVFSFSSSFQVLRNLHSPFEVIEPLPSPHAAEPRLLTVSSNKVDVHIIIGPSPQLRACSHGNDVILICNIKWSSCFFSFLFHHQTFNIHLYYFSYKSV